MPTDNPIKLQGLPMLKLNYFNNPTTSDLIQRDDPFLYLWVSKANNSPWENIQIKKSLWADNHMVTSLLEIRGLKL